MPFIAVRLLSLSANSSPPKLRTSRVLKGNIQQMLHNIERFIQSKLRYFFRICVQLHLQKFHLAFFCISEIVYIFNMLIINYLKLCSFQG